MKFTPEKYELLYVSRKRRDNLQLSLRLGEVVLQLKEEVCILGLYFDSKRIWKKHQKSCHRKSPNISQLYPEQPTLLEDYQS